MTATRDSYSSGFAKYHFLITGPSGVTFRHTVEAQHSTFAIEAVRAAFAGCRFVLQLVERIDA